MVKTDQNQVHHETKPGRKQDLKWQYKKQQLFLASFLSFWFIFSLFYVISQERWAQICKTQRKQASFWSFCGQFCHNRSSTSCWGWGCAPWLNLGGNFEAILDKEAAEHTLSSASWCSNSMSCILMLGSLLLYPYLHPTENDWLRLLPQFCSPRRPSVPLGAVQKQQKCEKNAQKGTGEADMSAFTELFVGPGCVNAPEDESLVQKWNYVNVALFDLEMFMCCKKHGNCRVFNLFKGEKAGRSSSEVVYYEPCFCRIPKAALLELESSAENWL